MLATCSRLLANGPLWDSNPQTEKVKKATLSYGASLAIWDHTVLPATRHKWMRPTITSASQAGTWFAYPGGMKGWVDLGSLITARPGIEPTTTWSQVRRPITVTPPSHRLCALYKYSYIQYLPLDLIQPGVEPKPDALTVTSPSHKFWRNAERIMDVGFCRGGGGGRQLALIASSVVLQTMRHAGRQRRGDPRRLGRLYSVSQKKNPPLRFSDIFSQMVGNFWSKFYVPIIRSYLR